MSPSKKCGFHHPTKGVERDRGPIQYKGREPISEENRAFLSIFVKKKKQCQQTNEMANRRGINIIS